MDMNIENDFFAFNDMSLSEFAQFGLAEFAYIKKLQDGEEIAVGVFAADGTPLAILDEYADALALIAQNDLVSVSLH